MKRNRITIACTAAGLLATAGALSAAPGGQGPRGKGPPSPEAIVQRLDTDGDGKLSAAEADNTPRGRLAEYFATIDANSDGYLVPDELEAFAKQRRGTRGKGPRVFAAMDADSNGALSYDEVADAGARRMVEHFDAIDANGDGELDKQELIELRRIVKDRLSKRRNTPRGR